MSYKLNLDKYFVDSNEIEYINCYSLNGDLLFTTYKPPRDEIINLIKKISISIVKLKTKAIIDNIDNSFELIEVINKLYKIIDKLVLSIK